jgi:uncharacterized protein
MRAIMRSALHVSAALMLGAMVWTAPGWAQAPESTPQYPGLPSETPAQVQPSTQSFDYVRRDVMIPMRDGVKLHTVILIPKGAKNAPIILTRTPYNASEMVTHEESSHLGPSIFGYDNPTDVIVQGGYIRVIQDVRGKYGSEGDYVMNRPLHGPLNPTPVDNATDTYDTIDWLVKNVPESNGKVGILGISYDGFTTLMALVHPHPALKVAIPMNPMVDGWMGDDWFHYGAFREQNMPYIYEQEATRSNTALWWHSHFDDYDEFLQQVNAGEMGKLHGLQQVGFWRKILQHPTYDSWWREQAMDKILAAQPLKVPTMLVDSLWDQEDIYGAVAVYKAIKPKDIHNNMVYLVLGPWHHGQEIGDGSTLGALNFHSDTALYFRQHILAPFLAHYLKDDDSRSAEEQISPVYAYETGTDRWLRLSSWPSGCPAGCSIHPTPLYLKAGLKLSYMAPQDGDSTFDQYVSDPAKPVPFRIRPVRPIGYDILKGFSWPLWLVDDQREFSTRPDVLVYVSDLLHKPEKISGQPVVHLVASTTGTDSDWVVKLIDLYPDQVAEQQNMGGYQLMVSADIFRGRYRQSFETPGAIVPDKPLLYHFLLPTADHVFLPGHRIMVQIQSSWFPLYDRNPQTFVPDIFWARPEDYRKANQRVYHAPGEESYIELPLVVTH